MRQIFIFSFFILLLSISSVYGQTNFREAFEKSDPIPKLATLPLEERLSTHQPFLERAIQENDPLKQIYGNLYIFYDYIRASNFSEASRYLLEAENIAKASNHIGWQGWVSHRRGILFVLLDKEQEAIEAYERAAQQCAQARDSLCLGESWEQIGAGYAKFDNFVEAQKYFDKGFPLIEKYGTQEQISASLNNFGIILSRQNKASEAIPYFKKSIEVNRQAKNYRAEGKGMNNLADAYRRLNQNDLAIKTYQNCIQFNLEHGLLENLITNYMGLYVLYRDTKNYKAANEFFIKHIDLRDSIIGVQTNERIAELEAKYDSEHKELALQKSQADLVKTQHKLERGTLYLCILLLLGGLGVWRWRWQIRQSARILAENEENLTNLTRLLLQKNTLLSVQAEQISALQAQQQLSLEEATVNEKDFEDNLYNQRILTDADWAAFKIYFEKTYPKYLARLRTTHPELSEAEERLFLFVKLNLNKKEIADILGISPDSVKKTRSRLRKRLELDQEVSLETYIRNF